MTIMEDLIGDIYRWQRETFGQQDERDLASHLIDEAKELYEATLDRSTTPAEQASEMADIFILLSGIVGLTGTDLADAVRTKMAINRARKWPRTPNQDGKFFHLDQPTATAG